MTQEDELKSRMELMDRLFAKFKEGLILLGGWDAVSYSGPMCEVLIRAVQELGTFERDKDIDKLIDKIIGEL